MGIIIGNIVVLWLFLIKVLQRNGQEIDLRRKKELLLRFILVSIYAIGVLYILQMLIKPLEKPGETSMDQWALDVLYIVCFNIGSEGNLFIDRYLNRKMPWFIYAKKRLNVQLVLTIIWTVVMTAIPFTIRLLLLLMYDMWYATINFFKNWKSSLLEVERLKQEKLKTEYKLLQDQLNPHFLFNSFNVLISEITHNPQTAIDFTRKLSQVYRYVLQSRNNDLVKLQDELEFIKSFVYLHKIRVGEALQFECIVDEKSKEKYLPPLTIQVLFENAIKHNLLTKERPLNIRIENVSPSLIKIVNNLQIKDAIDSTQTGLSNIKDRYSLLGLENIIIEKNENEFSVTIPLLEN
jgi:hypothetical protein